MPGEASGACWGGFCAIPGGFPADVESGEKKRPAGHEQHRGKPGGATAGQAEDVEIGRFIYSVESGGGLAVICSVITSMHH